MQHNNTQQKQEYSRAYLIRLLYFIASGFGLAYWFLFLVLHPLMHLSVTLQLMTLPYSVMGLALLLVARDAFRAGRYIFALHFFVGLLIAGSLA